MKINFIDARHPIKKAPKRIEALFKINRIF